MRRFVLAAVIAAGAATSSAHAHIPEQCGIPMIDAALAQDDLNTATVEVNRAVGRFGSNLSSKAALVDFLSKAAAQMRALSTSTEAQHKLVVCIAGAGQ